MITCGIDWAEARHDLALVDDQGQTVARCRTSADAAGLTAMLELIAEHGGDPATTPIAIDTDKNLFVVALAAAGFTIHPINPKAVAAIASGTPNPAASPTPGDAIVLAHILRTDHHLHRRLPAVSERAAAVKVLARQHQEAIWAWHQAVSRLRSVLLEFYPQALKVFPNLKHHAATTVLAAAPSPAAARTLTRRRIVTLLRQCGRRCDPELIEKIITTLRTDELRQPSRVENAYAATVTGLLPVLVRLREAVSQLEEALAAEFADHPLAQVLTSAPGLGPVLGARLLAEIGDDPTRFASADGLRAFAGTAPVTRASGRSRWVVARKVRDKRLADACHWWAYASLTRSSGARAHYDRRRAVGDTHNAALRNLANKLIGRLWWCLLNQQPWDDDAAWPKPQLRAA